MAEKQMGADYQATAASRFFIFVGATLFAVGAICIITVSNWFWILFGVGWLIFFFGIWAKNVIKMGLEKKDKNSDSLV